MMSNHQLVCSDIDVLANALVDQEYCGRCPYDEDGICTFDADKEDGTMHMACFNAALEWLMGDAK